MIVVCDVNTIWRHRPFAALAEQSDVLGISPCDPFVARKQPVSKAFPDGPLKVLRVVLPPRWASKAAWLGQRMLWRSIKKAARRQRKEIKCLVVTSPHYLTLLNLLPSSVKTIYYASDDYRSYEGWSHMAEQEALVVQRVDHSFLISEALAARARKEYGVSADRISVSMNATEDRFFPLAGESLPCEPPSGALQRPIAGIVGGINDRLDFKLLKACADLPELGTLLLVGPLPPEPSPALAELLKHPKCISVGGQPHASIHQWFKCLDVGLIPYAATELNTYCSPMRLFDHLASGAAVVATDACDQVGHFTDQIEICSEAQAFLCAVEERLTNGSPRYSDCEDIAWKDRAGPLLKVIEEMSND